MVVKLSLKFEMRRHTFNGTIPQAKKIGAELAYRLIYKLILILSMKDFGMKHKVGGSCCTDAALLA